MTRAEAYELYEAAVTSAIADFDSDVSTAHNTCDRRLALARRLLTETLIALETVT